MIYIFDKREKLIQIIRQDCVKEAYRIEEINTPGLFEASVLGETIADDAEYIAHKDPVNSKYIHLYKILDINIKPPAVKIFGIESFYDDMRADGYIKDIRPTNKTVREIAGTLLTDSRWSLGAVDAVTVGSINFYYLSRLEALQKLLEATGMELRPKITFSGNKITFRVLDIVQSLGKDRGKRFVHGSNLLDIVTEDTRGAIYTALIGRGKGEEILDESGEATGGFGRRIMFTDIVWHTANGDPVEKPKGQDYVEIPEMTAVFGYPNGKPRIGIIEFPDIEDPKELLRATYEELQTCCRPQVTYKASVRDVGDTGLGDTVAIIRNDLNIRYKVRVVKRTVNLLNPRLTGIELGDKIKNYTVGKIQQLEKQIKDNETRSGSLYQRLIDILTDTYWGENGYNYDLKIDNEYGLPAGFYSFDKPIDQSPTKFIYVGAGKLVISNSKNPDGTWKLTTIATGDGFIAENMFAGKISADLIRLESSTLTDKIGQIEDDIENIELTPGADGVGVASVIVEYTVVKGGGKPAVSATWSTAPPAEWADDEHVWQRFKVTYTDNSVKTTIPTCLSDAEARKAYEKAKALIEQKEREAKDRYQDLVEQGEARAEQLNDLLSDNRPLTPAEKAQMEALIASINHDVTIVSSKLEEEELSVALQNASASLIDELKELVKDGTTYKTVNRDQIKILYGAYIKAVEDAQVAIDAQEAQKYTDLQAGQATLGEKIGKFESQLKLEPSQISIFVNVNDEEQSIEAMTLTQSELAFFYEGSKAAWIGTEGLEAPNGKFASLAFGLHKADVIGDYTVISYVGGKKG